MLLIGSRAAKFHFSDFREPKDWDFIVTPLSLSQWIRKRKNNILRYKMRDDEKKVFVHLKTGERIEFELAKPGNSASKILFCTTNYYGAYPNIGSYGVATPYMLYLIKRSHVKHPIKWEKTIRDYHFLIEKLKGNRGVVPYGTDPDLSLEAFDMREKEVNERMKGRLPKVNLNMTNEQFFAKSEGKLGRAYEHDDLHRVTAYGDTPMYEQLKHDKTKAKLDKDLWDMISYEDQIRTVREECYAIALERILIPAMEEGKELDEKSAFEYALMRICTTLTKGWFQDFAIGSWPVIKDYDRNFLKLFQEAVESGKIRRIDRG